MKLRQLFIFSIGILFGLGLCTAQAWADFNGDSV